MPPYLNNGAISDVKRTANHYPEEANWDPMTTRLGVNKVELTENGISVEWNDGHESLYDYTYLRINCGCAECVEEWSNRKLLDPASVPADIHAEDYLMVGRYAVQFLWSDAHYTGIYPFEMLRSLCRCEQCKAAAG